MTEIKTDGCFQHIVQSAAANREPVKVEGHHPFVLMHDDMRNLSLEEFAERPYYVKVEQTFKTTKAFIQYVNDFALPQTRLFAESINNAVGAVIDYHGTDGQASHCAHTARLKLIGDRDLQKWLRGDGEETSQQEFVRFLVDYAGMVKDATYKVGADPIPMTASDFLELVSNIKSVNTSDIESKASVGGNVELKMAMKSQVKANGGELPERISVALPVYQGGDPYIFDFRIMIKVDREGSARFSFRLIRPEATLEMAFNDVVQEVQDGLNEGLKIYGL